MADYDGHHVSVTAFLRKLTELTIVQDSCLHYQCNLSRSVRSVHLLPLWSTSPAYG